MPRYTYPTDFVNTNWKVLDGDVYVSKSGDDDKGDGSPQRPYATLQKGTEELVNSQSLVVGTGRYDELVEDSSKRGRFFADGYVVMSGVTGTGGISSPFRMNSDSSWTGFRFEDYNQSAFGHHFNCVFRNVDRIIVDQRTMKYCTLINCRIGGTSNTLARAIVVHNTFVNCDFDNGGQQLAPSVLRDNIFDVDCGNIRLSDANALEIDYNNYENNSINGNDLAAHRAATGFDGNSISADPQFNNKRGEDYTLNEKSPSAQAASDGYSHGAYNTATSLSSGDSRLTGNMPNVQINAAGDFELIDPTQIGTILSDVIDLGELKSPMGVVHLFAENDFPQDVVDSTTGSGNENPNHLTYEMRYSESPMPEKPDAKTPFRTFLSNRIPTVDNGGHGNGDSSFVITEEQSIEAQYVQVRITLRPDGSGN